jgi:DNA-binding transcriptional ArsR family regulator
MVQCRQASFDALFAALSDTTRRGVLEQLGRADASITDLAKEFHMTLTGMKKHVGVLEQVGLVGTEKIGRVRTASSACADWRTRQVLARPSSNWKNLSSPCPVADESNQPEVEVLI